MLQIAKSLIYLYFMNFKNFIFVVGAVFLMGCASTHEQLYEKKLAFYSYIAGGVEDSSPSLEYQPDVYATPASCQKVVTALLSYKVLGSEYRFQTQLMAAKKYGKIHDLVIRFSGDPTLTSQDLIDLLNIVNARNIPGTIFIDASGFKTPPYSPNLVIDDMGTAYSTPVSASSLDQNLIAIDITPGFYIGQAHIENDAGYSIDSNVITNDQKSKVSIKQDGNALKATGNIHIAGPIITLKKSPKNIENFILKKFKNILKAVEIQGRVVYLTDSSKLPAKLEQLGSHFSKPLSVIIPPALKRSDNLVFDSLYLKLIHMQGDEINEWQDGDKIIKQLLKTHFLIDMDGALFVDGSGLSRYNRVQPRQLFKLLQKGYEVKDFVAALPYPGEQLTTLANRKGLPSSLRAKTGGMSGISGLCGYVGSDASKQVFVVIANSFKPPISETTSTIDEFILDYFGSNDDSAKQNIVL